MSEEIVYKYKWRFLPLAWLLIFFPVFLAAGVVAIKRQGLSSGALLLVISLTVIAIVYWLLILGLADIHIDDKVVSKRAFGVTWQRVSWVDVEKF